AAPARLGRGRRPRPPLVGDGGEQRRPEVDHVRRARAPHRGLQLLADGRLPAPARERPPAASLGRAAAPPATLPLPVSPAGGAPRACRIRPTTTPVNGNGATRAVSSTPAATSSRWNIGQAHGAFPPPDNGRLIEWFADTAYTTSCILFGPMGTPAPGFTWTAAAACVTPPLWPGPTRPSCRALGRALNCHIG